MVPTQAWVLPDETIVKNRAHKPTLVGFFMPVTNEQVPVIIIESTFLLQIALLGRNPTSDQEQ